jgi:large subunit ribosomal protein L19
MLKTRTLSKIESQDLYKKTMKDAMEQKPTKQTIAYQNLEDRGFDAFSVGDTVIVSQKVKEAGEGGKAGKERIQNFQGTVISITNRGISSVFMVRKIGAHGVSVERIFPYYAPFIHTVKIVTKGRVRRAKLYYLRHKVGKAAVVAKKVMSQEQAMAAQIKSEKIEPAAAQ